MKFKLNQKGIMKSATELGAMTAGAIGGNQFLDFTKIFKDTPHDSFMIKHQGGVKAVGSLLLLNSGMKMSPLMRAIVMGIGIGGAVKEARVLIGKDAKGIDTIDAIGNDDQEKLDELLLQASKMGRITNENVTTTIGNPNQYAAYTAVGMGDQLIPYETRF